MMASARALPPPRAPSLEPVLRCPRCHRVWRGADVRMGDAMPRCWHPKCGMRWWFMVLSAGPVAPQLAEAFDDLAPHLMAAYGLPATLDAPMFWQLPLTPHEAHLHRASAPLALFRALALLPFIAA